MNKSIFKEAWNKKISIGQIVILLLILLLLLYCISKVVNKYNFDKNRVITIIMRNQLNAFCIYVDDYLKETGALPSEEILKKQSQILKNSKLTFLNMWYYRIEGKNKDQYIIFITNEKSGFSIVSQPQFESEK